ncbi:glycosyltransferase family 39 protein [Coleofasciculus sp. E2-BRE-01]|uniref:glycosyltransferase family 39 protein n=1 Tax=Coleofasciculus sp. E2-BRE-01 TaxID=3069524 RepID=UPI0032F8E70C
MKIGGSRATTYILLAILITAAILRFNQINQPFIDVTSWRQSDTATIADNFYQGHWNIFYPKISWNGPGDNYVGYEFQTITYIAALLYRIIGHHDWVARSVAVTFGVWGIFAFYQLVRRIWSEKHALISAALLAILPGQIYVDRSFLPDPVMLSLVVTSVWLMVAFLQTERLHYLILSSLTGLLGFLTKISGIFVGIAMLYAIVTILRQKQKLRSKQLAVIGAAAVAVLSLVIAYYLWAIHISKTYPPYYIAAGGYWVWKFGLRHFLEQNYFLPKLYFQLDWFWTKPLILFVAIGLVLRPPQSEHQSRDSISSAPWLFHWWIIAFAIYYLIAAQGLVNNPTNLNLINPAAAALTSNVLIVGFSFIRRIAGFPTSLALITTLLILIIGIGQHKLKTLAFRPWAANDYQLGLALRQISQPDDLVVTATSTTGDTVAIYYSQRDGWVFPPAYTWSSLSWSELDDEDAILLLKELSDKGATWLGIVNKQKNQLSKEKPKLIEYMERTFEVYQKSPRFMIYHITAQE